MHRPQVKPASKALPVSRYVRSLLVVPALSTAALFSSKIQLSVFRLQFVMSYKCVAGSGITVSHHGQPFAHQRGKRQEPALQLCYATALCYVCYATALCYATAPCEFVPTQSLQLGAARAEPGVPADDKVERRAAHQAQGAGERAKHIWLVTCHWGSRGALEHCRMNAPRSERRQRVRGAYPTYVLLGCCG